MSKLLKKIFWVLLFLFVVLVAALVAAWGIHYKDWHNWLGLTVGAGIIGCFLFVLFLKKYLVRRRGKKLVEQIVEQEQILNEEDAPDLLQVKELEKSWYANLALLRDSHLRSKGNPVYVLPWYLAIGATGTGKTTAISNFALAASFTGTEQNSQSSATRNCDWWFLNKAIVLDVAGRYAVPVEGTGDQEEWKRFLGLLAKYRKREPLSGILLFVGADEIREAAADLLKKQAQLLRNRIDNLMRTIGYRIPVRVIVTKMDLVPGFLGFADSFAPDDHKQVMGSWNRRGNPFWREVLNEVMLEIGERLRELRQEYVLDRKKYKPDFLVFPENFEQLHNGLSSFLEPVFSENRFQETPYLAGIYFGSGRAPLSVDPSGRGMKLSEGGRTFFLTEFFSRILADGRERLEPVKEFMLWRRMTRSLGLMSWWLICLFCAGVIGISFLNNQKSLGRAEGITQEIIFSTKKPSEPGEFNATVLELDKLRREIIKLEGLNQSHTLSNISFGHAVNTEQELKTSYCQRFETVLQQPLENRLAYSISSVTPNTPNNLFADYADFSVEYIYLLQQYLDKTLEQALKDEDITISSGFSPAAARIMHFQDGNVSSEVAGSFADLNKYYLFWTEDRNTAVSRLKILQSDVVKLLAHRPDDVSWLYHPLITETHAIGLSNFWSHKILQRYNIFFVEGAFTGEGRKKIHAFFEMTAEAMKRRPDAGSLTSTTEWVGEKMLDALRRRFRQSYETVFFARWYNFAENFSVARNSLVKEDIPSEEEGGESNLRTEPVPSGQDEAEVDLSTRHYYAEKWREAAIRMTKASNPYFNLIGKMAEEIKKISEDEEFLDYGAVENATDEEETAEEKEKVASVDLPPWAESVIAFDKVRQQAEEIRKSEGKGLSATAAKVTSGFNRIKNKLGLNKAERIATKTGTGKKQAGSAVSETELASAWNQYQKTLIALEAATPYQEKTFQVMSNWFREAVTPEKEVSLYGKTYKAVGILHGLAKGKYENSFAWRLVESPFNFLTEFGLKESATVLQEHWMEQVVAQAEVVDKNKLIGVLFEKENGVVWKFAKGSGGPFLQNTVHGYQSRNVFSSSLALEPSLYTFLDQGASVVLNRQADYRVQITNRPMKVNRDATEEPHTSAITVQCADDEIVLENDNYPRTQNFTWSPDTCGDVNLTIEFPGATLHKNYKGNMAFADFLAAFVDGALRLTPADFPEEKGHLQNANIKEIILTYAIKGQERVLRLLELKPNVPKVIALPEQQRGESVFN
jgi:type VI secretion system protein ImpL